ncbi:MAG: ferrous iron transport protein B [Muribaculaceae bacterium]|nr:ferrous iron transport protein B [Muribaculaceae bacterium]
MKLSDLKKGERGVIVKVQGHGSFRKRIIEMGFIKGKTVEALLDAPLADPVKYRVMGYEVSLRRDEASMIEIVGGTHAELSSEDNYSAPAAPEVVDERLTEDQMLAEARRQRRVINVAIVGNPNCGKTSLFNFASGAHARVGNYSGVTVDATEATAHYEGYEFKLIDLPGTYSLSAYSPEELYVRRHIIDRTPDVIINVIDTSNLERNLYLTTQLIDMNLRVVCALNMIDEVERRGDEFDIDKLSQLFGVPMIPTSFRNGRGVELLFHIIINMYEGADYLDEKGRINPEVAQEIRQWHKDYASHTAHDHQEDFASSDRPVKNYYRHIHVNHGKYVERGIDLVKNELQRDSHLRHRYSTRYLAIKLLENDKQALNIVSRQPNHERVEKLRQQAAAQILADTQQDSETAIMDAKYAFIRGALSEAGYKVGDGDSAYRVTHAIDHLLSHKYLGFPIFFLILFVMFETTFVLGQYPMDWLETGVAWIGDLVGRWMPSGMLKDMIVDGVIAGVGSVIVFLPQILILYLFISFMDDSGYMARAAFIMDKLMHKMGLHGKSFIPLIMGFGCNVPAVMATRTIESRRSRIITMMILPFMSCSARLPIYVMITGTFFALQWRSLVMISLYVVGVIVAVIVSNILSRLVIKGEDTPFVMELPPYRLPTHQAVVRHTWDKGKEYLKKMGGVILVASIIVWALGYFPHHPELTAQQQQEQSIIGRVGQAIEPVFEPQGFNWKLDVSLVAGLGAKEIVASSVGVLYNDDDSFGDDEGYNDEGGRYTTLHALMAADGITPLSAYCYLLFVLLYFPCLATIVAIKNETGGWRWAITAAVYTTVVAWVVSAAVNQIGLLLMA